jgi:hypothetical protein
MKTNETPFVESPSECLCVVGAKYFTRDVETAKQLKASASNLSAAVLSLCLLRATLRV